MGWSREAVKDYKALKKIDSEAWSVIGASFSQIAPDDNDSDAPAFGANAPKTPFTEGLLRNILDLEPCQQVELCGYLAKGKDKKGHKYSKADFKNDAVWYRAFNILWNGSPARAWEPRLWPMSATKQPGFTRARVGATQSVHVDGLLDPVHPRARGSHLNRPKLGVPNRAYLGGVLFYRCGKFQALALGICLQGSRKTRAKPSLCDYPRARFFGRTYLVDSSPCGR